LALFVLLTVGTASLVRGQENLILNGEFDDGLSGWRLYGGAGFTVDVVQSTDATAGSSIGIAQSGLQFVQGKTYEIGLTAKADQDREMVILIQLNDPAGQPAWIDVLTETVALTTEPQTFVLEYTHTRESMANHPDWRIDIYYMLKGSLWPMTGSDLNTKVWLDRLYIGQPGAPQTRTRAVAPDPPDGAVIENPQYALKWTPGEYAVSHEVYFGETFDDVNEGNVEVVPTTMALLVAGVPGGVYPDGLVRGTTYYWRVDEVNDTHPESPWKGDVWSFWVQPETAWAPSPDDGLIFVGPDQILTWSSGTGALFHTVYFGETFDEVNDAVAGGWMTSDATHDPGPLELNKTYYWRVDEFAPAGTIKGDVWSFTTRPEIAVGDPSLLAWWTLDEGAGTNVLDWSGHDHHGTLAGDTQWADGYDGGALRFDGQGDSADFGTPPDLYLPQVHSYTAWFKVGRDINGDSGPQYILCIGSRSDLVFGVEDGVGVDGDLSLHYYDTVPGFHAIGVGKTTWRADEWHFVVGTKDAEGHKIYLDGELRNSDTNTNDDNFGGATDRIISIGARAWTGHQYYNGLIDDVRIYDKALTEAEVQQLMRGDPLLAWKPDPVPGAVVDIRDVTMLRWSPGETAASHDVYLGNDKNALESQGNQAATSFPLAGLVELGGGDYYWRIDEVEADGTVRTGRVWKFTVRPYLLIDDFESYTNDSPNRLFQTWVDGLGFSQDEHFPDGHPGNGTGAAVGHDIWNPDSPHFEGTIAEIEIVHGGRQSMPLAYNNTNAPWYSEAERTWAVPQDWTAHGVDTVTLYVRGAADNTPSQLYVVIEDSSGTVGVATTATEWVEVAIPASEFTAAGVNMAAVKKMSIGVGDRTGGTPGGAGVIYIDDVRLTKALAE
jgi:hypothetical protein